MKSPWRFLVELASRGGATKEQESARETETPNSDGSSLPSGNSWTPTGPTSELPPPAADAPNEVNEAAAKADPVLADENEAPPATFVDEPHADGHGDDAERAPSSQPLPQKVQRRIRKTSARSARAVVPIDGVDAGSSVAQPRTFKEEVADLDDEVRMLRRQLAEKLRMQNEQLKKLLKRFDAP